MKDKLKNAIKRLAEIILAIFAGAVIYKITNCLIFAIIYVVTVLWLLFVVYVIFPIESQI